MTGKSELKELYGREEDAKVKERLLLILRVEVDGAIPASAAKQLHRSRPWASYWLERFSKEGLDGLKEAEEWEAVKASSGACHEDKEEALRE